MPTLSSIKPLTVAKTLSKDTLHTVNMDPSNYLPSGPAAQPTNNSLISKGNNAVNSISKDVAGFGEGVLSPVTKLLASGVQNIKETPELLQAIPQIIAGALTHDQAKKQALLGAGNEKLNAVNNAVAAPVNLGLQAGPQQTLGGSTPLQNVGSAAQAASFLAPETGLSSIPSAAVTGGLQTGGAALENKNATAGSVAGATGEGSLAGALFGVLSKYVPDYLQKLTEGSSSAAPTEQAASDVSKSLSAQAIKNPADLEQAFNDGRISVHNGKSVVTPSAPQQKMIEALKPLEDAGKLKDPTGIGSGAMQNQLDNGATVQQEIDNTGQEIRNGIKGSKATWNGNELKGVANKVEVPDPVKNDATMAKNAASLRQAIASIGEDTPKTGEGTLDVRQKFDSYVKQNYGQNFFNKGRNADPLHQYVFSLRDGLSDWSASKLPEGKLPSGQTFRDALQRQHQLINASNEMSAKFANDFKGSETQGTISRWMKANPEKARFLRRAGYTAIGIGAAGAALRKQIGGLFTTGT